MTLTLTNLQNVFKLTCLEFYLTLELFIDHLKVSDKFESDDHDLDLQDQICDEAPMFFEIPCECDNF